MHPSMGGVVRSQNLRLSRASLRERALQRPCGRYNQTAVYAEETPPRRRRGAACRVDFGRAKKTHGVKTVRKEEGIMRVLFINGPNLNLLGEREPSIYGRTTLEQINDRVRDRAREAGVDVVFFQSNHEGEIVERIQKAKGQFDALVINPAGFTHTSVAIRDALVAVGIPAIEVHLSNPAKREAFRRRSLVSDVVQGTISGFGEDSYYLALQAAVELGKKKG